MGSSLFLFYKYKKQYSRGKIMLNFSNFAIYLEEGRYDTTDKKLNDDKGKLFEILTGSHLHGGSHSSGAPNKMLEHYRNEDQKTPVEVHDEIKSHFDKRHPGLYNEIAKHAKDAAHHIRGELAAQGHHTIHHGAWTSQKGDHEAFTSHKDPNSDADVMLRTNKGPVGISLKYGSMEKPNLRNPGFDTTERKTGMQKGELDMERQVHAQNLKDEGIAPGKAGHEQAKKWEKSGTPQQKAAMSRLRDSALNVQRKVAQKTQNKLSTMNSDQLKDYVANTISPKTKYQHFRYHALVNDKTGEASPHMSDMAQDRNKLDKFEEFKAQPHDGKNISVRIHGRRVGSSSWEPVLEHGVKKGSGVTKGFALTTKAPFLTEKNPKKIKDISSAPPAVDLTKAPVAPRKRVKQPITSEGHGEHGGASFNGPSEMPQ